VSAGARRDMGGRLRLGRADEHDPLAGRRKRARKVCPASFPGRGGSIADALT
jgi:hypothetical protein